MMMMMTIFSTSIHEGDGEDDDNADDDHDNDDDDDDGMLLSFKHSFHQCIHRLQLHMCGLHSQWKHIAKGSPLIQNPSIKEIETFKWSSAREYLQEQCPDAVSTCQELLPDPQYQKVIGMKSWKRFVTENQLGRP